MPNNRVLVIDDEETIRRFLRVALSSQGYAVIEQSSGQEGISSVTTEKPDVIILDLGLPDIDGVEVTRLLRQWTQIPIIILSVRGSESDKIAALDGELLARLRAAMRHSIQKGNESVFTVGSLKVDLSKRLVTVSGREVQLTPNEYELLRILVTDAGKVLTHRHLLHKVWGAEYGDESHMLHVNISNLRRKIEADPARPQFIITEPGVGYRLRTD
jgi:two-component system KDP operon response regulator KdpE